MPLILGQGGSDGAGGFESIVSLLSGATASISNKISSVVSEILPGFVDNNHSKFVDFMEAYYEWMEQKENPHGTSVTLVDLMDIDKSLDSFIEYFKDVYLKDFPKNLAIDSFGNPLNEKTIVKNINDFYSSKGTEKSYKFFLRILHDSDVEFYYPKEDILRLSDGKWIEKKSIKVTSNNGAKLFDLSKKTITQKDAIGSGVLSVASATVESILQYNVEQYFVTELFLTDINGTFLQGNKIEGLDDNNNKIQEDIYSIPSVVNVLSKGAGYRYGDRVLIDENSNEYVSGKGAEVEVDKVDKNGAIESVIIKNFGTNYTTNTSEDTVPVYFRSTSGDGSASGYASLKALCVYPGYWLNNDGKLSSNKYSRDNEKYCEFSYVLKTEIALDSYKDQVLKTIHPTGTRLFGNISLLNTVSSAVPYHTEIVRIEPPIIGHFTPYTLNTHDNLRGATGSGSVIDLYPRGFNPGATSAGHCLGNTGGRLALTSGGTGGFTLGSMVIGDSVTGSSSGATGIVFGWSRSTSTGGVLFIKTGGTGGPLGFTAGERVDIGKSGSTGIIGGGGGVTGNWVGVGNGTVLENDATIHVTGPAGGLSSGATSSQNDGLTHWTINSSFQSAYAGADSVNITETLNVKTFTDTSPYTAGYDYSIGNAVQQQDLNNLGISASGIVQDWIPPASGGTGGVLKIQQIGTHNFGVGTIFEINNYNGSISITNNFAKQGSDETIRNKIKHLKLEDIVQVPSAGSDRWLYHSGDSESGVTGGYTQGV